MNQTVPPPENFPLSVESSIKTIQEHQVKAKFAGWIMVFIFLVLIGVTFLALWYFETQERGNPDLQNEAKQFVEEVKKELN